MSERTPEPCPNCGTITRLDTCPTCGYQIRAVSTPEPEPSE